jgi:hypothetical protein
VKNESYYIFLFKTYHVLYSMLRKVVDP